MLNLDYVLAILFIGYVCLLIYSFRYITGGMLWRKRKQGT